MGKGDKIFVVGSFIFFVFLLLFLLGVVVKFKFSKKEEESQSYYQVFEFVPSSNINKTLRGSVQIGSKLKKGEFVLYSNREGNKVFVSTRSRKIKNEEYECNGGCYCDDEKSDYFSRFIYEIFLVTAASTSDAMEFVKKGLAKNCKKKMKGCKKASVRAEVLNCEVVNNRQQDDQYYGCRGNCLATVEAELTEATVDCPEHVLFDHVKIEAGMYEDVNLATATSEFRYKLDSFCRNTILVDAVPVCTAGFDFYFNMECKEMGILTEHNID